MSQPAAQPHQQQPAINLHHLQWRAPEFLLSLPQGQLTTPQLAMEYFTLSPFFDKTSSNAQLRMQIMFSRGGGMEGVDEEAELARFTGIEFVVSHSLSSPPDLFILHKRRRTSPSETTVLGAYHILNGNVYQAPSLFQVLNERLLTSTHALATSFEAFTALKPAWTAERLYAWEIKPPPPSSAAAATSTLAAVPTEEGDADQEKAGLVVGDDSTAGLDATTKKEEQEEEESDRPAEQFNPLLFRALQSVAQRTEAEAVRTYQREQQQREREEAQREGEGGKDVRMAAIRT
ncbi:hypothetical protein JCM10908_002209 [Rhodotorula pacifica]|uniref:mediator complex subunit MED6 n=1 Tax=Rhodotorula pacifica TaxID=1495444 RepID=UPI00317A86C0